MSTRPTFSRIKSSREFRQWYWQKDELVAICKKLNLPYSAGKFALVDRIADHLDGKPYQAPKKTETKSTFDWSSARLSKKTVITDSYKNNQNVRAFFTKQVGKGFSFSIDLMQWMKKNNGKTLGDAVDFYIKLQAKKKIGYRQEIPDHNQYNAYIRAFTEANPDLSIATAKKCWQWKRRQPSKTGRHRYHKSDLKHC